MTVPCTVIRVCLVSASQRAEFKGKGCVNNANEVGVPPTLGLAGRGGKYQDCGSRHRTPPARTLGEPTAVPGPLVGSSLLPELGARLSEVG